MAFLASCRKWKAGSFQLQKCPIHFLASVSPENVLSFPFFQKMINFPPFKSIVSFVL